MNGGLISRVPGRLRSFAAEHSTSLVALLLFCLGAYLVSSSFLPNLDGIGAWDESAYVNAGRRLLDREVPDFAGNPLVAVLYALTYLPYSGSAFWLVHSTSLGRLIQFTLVWLSGYAVSRQLQRWTHPLVVLGLFFVSSIPLALLAYPSDPLFVSMAAFSFWKLLSFYNSNRLSDLALSSVFLGLAALSRNDGLLMGPVLVLLGLVIGYGKVRLWKTFLAAAAPFAVLVFGYVLLYGLISGNFRLGTMGRTYDNFEAGQQAAYSGEGSVNPVLEAKIEARRLFGTPEENGNSVFRAILRNPGAYLVRLRAVVRQLPDLLLSAYGQRLAALLMLLAVRGTWELWRRGDRRLLLAFLLWPAHLAAGFAITIFRLGHLSFPFYALYGLSAIGLSALVANRADRRERGVWLIALVALAVLSKVLGASAVEFGALAFGAALVLIYWLWPGQEESSRQAMAPAFGLVFLAVGLLLHGDFTGPKSRTLGERPVEQAVLFMQEAFEPGTPIAAGSPGPIYAARMTYMGLTSLDIPVDRSQEDFLKWMRGQGIEAVYVDYSLTQDSPGLWRLIEGSVGSGLVRVFTAGGGDLQVLVVEP